jgi:ubiquinone/menaquinone biosynthesis C-methylase UbiE
MSMNLSDHVGALHLLGDESRMRLCALLGSRELSVTDLVHVTGLSQSRVSTHLGRLREAGFVRDRRDGQHAFYGMALDTLPETAKVILEAVSRTGDKTLREDQNRLEKLDHARESERRGGLPDSFAGEMERHYSPGRTWQSLGLGLAGLLALGDVLDLGSGDGAAAACIAPYSKTLTCVDSSPRMVAAAQARLAPFRHASARVANAQALPFSAASFDAVVVFHTLTYAEHPRQVLHECARVLRPNGRVVLLSLATHEHRSITAAFGERHAGFSVRELRGMLTRASLSVSTCELACRELRKPSFEVILAVASKRAAAPRSRARHTPTKKHVATARPPKAPQV